MDNTKDAFIWLKDNYSSLTESEYNELADKWGKLKVYCPIIVDEVSLYELNELSYVNGEWSFEVLSTESDESKLNGDYPIIPKSETTKDDDDWTKWASYMETQVTESGAVKDETVCEPNGTDVIELTEEEVAKLNDTTEETTDDGITGNEEEIISTDEDSSEIVESSDVVEETIDEVTESTEETTEQESSDVVEEISDTVTEDVSDEVVEENTTELEENTDTTDENSTVENTVEELTSDTVEETTDSTESTDDNTVIEENNLEETTENVTN